MKYIHILFLLQMFGIQTSCETKDNAIDSTVDSSSSIGFIEQVNVVPTESNPLARYVDVALSEKGSISLEFWHSGGPHFNKRFTAVDTDHFVPLIGLSPDSTVHFVVHARSGDQSESSDIFSFETDSLPFPAPEFTILNPMDPDGVITIFGVTDQLNPEITASYVGIDRAGEVVWIGRNQMRGPTHCGFLEPYSDELLLEAYPLKAKDWDTRGILNQTSDLVETMDSPLMTHHDFAILPSGNILGLVAERQNVRLQNGEDSPIRGDRIVEFRPDNQVVWEWSAFDFLDPSSFTPPKNGNIDWTHANNLQYLPQTDEILVGFRNLDLLVTIDRSTKEITRNYGEDGDYTLASGQWFAHQHHGTLTEDATLTVFDNNYGEDQYSTSRVVQYRINETLKTMEETWSVELGYFYRDAGQAALLENGGLLIAAGGGVREEDVPVQIIEFDSNKEEIWNVQSNSLSDVYRTSRLVSGVPMPPEDWTSSEGL